MFKETILQLGESQEKKDEERSLIKVVKEWDNANTGNTYHQTVIYEVASVERLLGHTL